MSFFFGRCENVRLVARTQKENESENESVVLPILGTKIVESKFKSKIYKNKVESLYLSL